MTTRRHHIDPRSIDFDFETGGRDAQVHPIIQIGAVARNDYNGQVLEVFEEKLIFRESACEAEALKKAHYDRELWAAHAVEPITAMKRFIRFLRQHSTYEKESKSKQSKYYVADLFAFNADFDNQFLWALKERLEAEYCDEFPTGIFLPADWHVGCVYQQAVKLFKTHKELVRPENYQLGTLCEYFGVRFGTNEAHDALYDAKKCGELRFKMDAAKRELITCHAA